MGLLVLWLCGEGQTCWAQERRGRAFVDFKVHVRRTCLRERNSKGHGGWKKPVFVYNGTLVRFQLQQPQGISLGPAIPIGQLKRQVMTKHREKL